MSRSLLGGREHQIMCLIHGKVKLRLLRLT